MWTGIAEKLKVPTRFGIDQFIKIYDNNNEGMGVPRYFWKVRFFVSWFLIKQKWRFLLSLLLTTYSAYLSSHLLGGPHLDLESNLRY